MPNEDDVTLGEINRTLQRGIVDITKRLDSFETTTVRRDVYDANKQTADANTTAMLLRVEAVESDLEAMAGNRRQMLTLVVTSFVLPLIIGVIILLLNRGKL